MLIHPIKRAVTSERQSVANTFSNQLFLLNSPIIRSLEVLAIKGPLIFPRSERRAGTNKISAIKL